MIDLSTLDRLDGKVAIVTGASSFITGVELSVDGGWSAGGGAAQLSIPWDEWNGANGVPVSPASAHVRGEKSSPL